MLASLVGFDYSVCVIYLCVFISYISISFLSMMNVCRLMSGLTWPANALPRRKSINCCWFLRLAILGGKPTIFAPTLGSVTPKIRYLSPLCFAFAKHSMSCKRSALLSCVFLWSPSSFPLFCYWWDYLWLFLSAPRFCG